MLVYVNSFRFQPEPGTDEIIRLTANWVERRANRSVDPARLAEGIRELKFQDGIVLRSCATLTEDKKKAYPFWFCAQLNHPDDDNSGRRWTTEVGLYQQDGESPVECSVLLRTDEVSTRVTAPIQTTRPLLVKQLLETCRPLGQTPGMSIKRLTVGNAESFLRSIEYGKREYPIIVLSANHDGVYYSDPEKLRSIVMGLADVVCIPKEENTFAIEEIVGRRYMAFGGAINIVFPGRQGIRGPYYENVLFRREEIEDLSKEQKPVASEVLSRITHRTNLPLSWRHISPEKVRQEVLRARLARMIQRDKSGEHSQQLKEYTELLELADQELSAKDEEMNQIRSDYEAKEQEVRELRAHIDNLKHTLKGQQSNDDGRDDIIEAMAPLRDALADVLKGSPRLQSVVELMATLYPDRIVFLATARDSAKESDRGGFNQGKRALEILHKLATEYWQQLADGKSDQHAKTVFGKNEYAAKEAGALSNDGRRHRTFSYRGHDVVMEKHLKLGIKDSAAETLRVHFEWFAKEKMIIVGHCGKHLDF
jgi:hypothetical protein